MDLQSTNPEALTVKPVDGKFVVCKGQEPLVIHCKSGLAVRAVFDHQRCAEDFARLYALVSYVEASSSN